MANWKNFIFLAVFLHIIQQDFVRAVKKPYIVYLGAHTHGLNASLEDYQLATESHRDLLGSYLGSKGKATDAIFYSYTKTINGFAAHMDEDLAVQIASHPGVVSVMESKMYELHTTRSWDFMELEKNGHVIPGSIWARANFGEGVIVGNLDSGVWPESRSFSDEGYGPVPKRWRGSCTDNTSKDGVPCNRKLIGAKYFNKGMLVSSPLNVFMNSTRDAEGHGTHTLSTAAGGFVPRASLFGYANGTAKGGAPRARAAAYKVCWSGSCDTADILAGFDAAIHDGVDVLTISLGGDGDAAGEFDVGSYFREAVALGSLHAVMHGVTVVCSAGNSGPYEETVTNTAPWVTTVAATTIDRKFPNVLTLGNNMRIKGASLESKTLHSHSLYPVINGSSAAAATSNPDDASYCAMDSLDGAKVKGKIVVCVRGGEVPRVMKGMAILTAGGAGMILANDEMDGDEIVADPHVLPATMITFDQAVVLYGYMQTTRTPMATISPTVTELGVQPSPSVAAFSSRGPSGTVPSILKPDIAAPGVNILAAFTEYVGPSDLAADPRRSPYAILSGTSMACPHVAGIAALVRAVHHDWSPAAVRSAVMTTARTQDNTGSPTRDFDGTEATAFAYGAGNARPNHALDPGLVYDASVDDYLTFLCTLGFTTAELGRLSGGRFACPARPVPLEDLNYPAIVVPALEGAAARTVTRRVRNVGRPGTYRAKMHAPFGVAMAVEPPALEFKAVGEEKTFTVTLTPEKGKGGRGYMFGRLLWSDGVHYVRSPVVINALS